MMAGESCEFMCDLAAACALGAVSTAERLAFEAHAEECRNCTGELASYERVVDCLSMAAEQESPSPLVRERLLNCIGSVVESKSTSFLPQRSGARWLPWATAAAMTILSFAGLAGWRAASMSAIALRDQLEALGHETVALQVSLQAETEKSRRVELAERALNDPAATVVALEGKGPVEGLAGRIHWDRQNEIWAVITSLPAPQLGKAYQLWFITADQRKISAGLIKSYRSDCGFTVISVPADIGRLAAAAITLEQEGGAEEPTMPIYAAGELSL